MNETTNERARTGSEADNHRNNKNTRPCVRESGRYLFEPSQHIRQVVSREQTCKTKCDLDRRDHYVYVRVHSAQRTRPCKCIVAHCCKNTSSSKRHRNTTTNDSNRHLVGCTIPCFTPRPTSDATPRCGAISGQNTVSSRRAPNCKTQYIRPTCRANIGMRGGNWLPSQAQEADPASTTEVWTGNFHSCARHGETLV